VNLTKKCQRDAKALDFCGNFFTTVCYRLPIQYVNWTRRTISASTGAQKSTTNQASGVWALVDEDRRLLARQASQYKGNAWAAVGISMTHIFTQIACHQTQTDSIYITRLQRFGRLQHSSTPYIGELS